MKSSNTDEAGGHWPVHTGQAQSGHLAVTAAVQGSPCAEFGCGWHAGKTLTLTEFLQSLHLSQVKQLRNRVTAKTYKPPPMEKRRTSAAA